MSPVMISSLPCSSLTEKAPCTGSSGEFCFGGKAHCKLGRWMATPTAEPTQKNSAAVNEAIQSLKPWLANEASLTEENTKECCAALVDSLAQKARAATSSTSR